MEESNTANEVQKSFLSDPSPPLRRRSTFFERRESFVPQMLSENAQDRVQSNTEHDDERSQDLLRYHDQLLSEKQQWKEEVTKRRNKYHDLRQQYQLAVKAPSRTLLPYSTLTNEDIEFIRSKANISKLVDSQLKLHKSVKETLALVRRANELDNVVIKHCEERVRKIADNILEHSTIEPMET